MKTSLSFSILFIMSLVVFNQSNGQTKTSASASINIISPLSIERIDYSGSLAINIRNFPKWDFSTNPGIIQAKNLKSEIIQQPGNTFIPLAEFIIKGEDLYSFAISLPLSPVNFVNSASNDSIVFNNFRSISETTGILSKGENTFKIGANINYKPDLHSGIYNSPPIYITVNYNED